MIKRSDRHSVPSPFCKGVEEPGFQPKTKSEGKDNFANQVGGRGGGRGGGIKMRSFSVKFQKGACTVNFYIPL